MMRFFFHALKNNRFSSFMVLFVGLFYVLALSMGTHGSSAQLAEKKEKSNIIVSTKEIREKEELFKGRIKEHPVMIASIAALFLIVIFCGLYVDTALLNRKLKGEPWIAGGLFHGPVSWGIKDVGQVFIFLFFAETVILIIEVFINYFVDIGGIEKHLLLMLNSLLRDMAAAGFVIFLVTRRFGQQISQIGLTAKNLLKNIKTGLIGYLAVIPGILIVLIILSYVAQRFSYEPPVQPVVQIYLREQGKNYLILFTLFVAIVGPAIEEIFFRGFTYKAFRQRFGVRWALVASSGIFAGLHMNLMAFFPIFFLGVFLAYLYERTGSLVPCMTAHMLHNLIMVAMTLVFKNYST